ncbi:hypothetical protein AKJ16_DCAP16705, partial [Drosera capensis]
MMRVTWSLPFMTRSSLMCDAGFDSVLVTRYWSIDETGLVCSLVFPTYRSLILAKARIKELGIHKPSSQIKTDVMATTIRT